MKQIKWGLMGAGRMSGWFAEALSILPDANRYAIGSRDYEKGERFAKTYGFQKVYASYEDLVNDPEIDIIYIGTPIRYHYDSLMLAINAGKNVLCEKALTLNAAQAKAAYALAQEKHVFFMEAMWMKCQPAYRKMIEWIRGGLLGDILSVEARFHTKSRKGHRLFHYETAGGALLDLGIYPLTAVCDILGYHPCEIVSHAAIGKEKVDYMNSTLLSYENGSFASVNSGLALSKMISLFIVGTKGRIAIDEEFFFQAQHVEAYGYDDTLLGSFDGPFLKNGYEFEAMEVMDCLRNHKVQSDLVTPEDSLAVMELLDTLRTQWGIKFDFED